MRKSTSHLNNQMIFVSGAAGFIGANLISRLLADTTGCTIIGIDNMNDYYDPILKQYRLDCIKTAANNSSSRFIFIEDDISNAMVVKRLFNEYYPSIVINLAAQAGVRYSIINPDTYIKSNLLGFYNILEACRRDDQLLHCVYASSSSVYGGNSKVPFSEDDFVDNPVSLYAATKKSNELLAHSYSKLYNIPCTGLRFFTVYGPAGRPDMAYFSFTEKLLHHNKIQIFNYGNCKRDFTYIDDIIEGVMKIIQSPPEKCIGSDGLPIPPYIIYNIGNSNAENLMDFVHILSKELVTAGILPESFCVEDHMELVPMQPGDVPVTYADTHKLENDFAFKPSTKLRDGLRQFVEWYREYYMSENYKRMLL